MSEWLDRVINTNIEKGRIEGIEKGIEKGRVEGALNQAKKIAFNLKAFGYSPEEIAKIVSYDYDTVRSWFAQ